MPYTTVVAGTTITASWANANVRDQVITPFASASTRDSAITSPIEGMYADLADTDSLWRHNGTTWRIASRGLLGGTRWTGGGNLVTGLNTTELAIMTAASVTIPPLSTVEISVGVRLLASVSGDVYILRIRETNVGGVEVGEYAWVAPNNTSGLNQYFKTHYDNNTSTSKTVQYCVTAQRAAGTGTLTMIAGPAQHDTHIMTSVTGYTGVVTDSATP